MKRQILSLFLALLLLTGLSVPAYATDPESPRVVDNADLLSSDELSRLTNQVCEQRYALELEIVIVTTWDLDGKDVQSYADDFYDRNGYGWGNDSSGILLLLSMETREWYISTCGEAIYIFTNYALDRLGEDMVPYLSDGDYYEAFSHWVESLAYYVQAYRQGTPVDGYVPPDAYESPNGEEIVYYEPDRTGTYFLISLAVGLTAGLVTVLVMRSSMNTAKLQKGAADYLKSGSFRITRQHDIYLYSRVSRTAKPKNNGGGGSSVHRSSGGVSHGGRGGRF